MPARTPIRRKLSAQVAAIERHNGADDPRLDDLRDQLHTVGAEDDLCEAVAALLPDAPEIPEAVIALVRSARRRPIGAAVA